MGVAYKTIDFQSEYILTQHAWERMNQRGFSTASICLVLNYGRIVHVRGATIYVVGRKEVEWYRQDGTDLSSVEGVHVVCTNSGAVLTAYRNRDLRGLRPRSRNIYWHRAC